MQSNTNSIKNSDSNYFKQLENQGNAKSIRDYPELLSRSIQVHITLIIGT